MRIRPLLFASSLFFVLLLLAARASAQSLEVDVRPGFGSSGSTSPVRYAPTNGASISPSPDSIFTGGSSPYGIGFAGDAAVGIKIMRFFSVGLMGQYRTMSATAPANDPNSISKLSRSAIGGGLYVHGYVDLPLLPIVPWVGVGASYLQDTQNYNATFGGVPATVQTIHYGVQVPLTIGVLYPFAHFFSVGPSFTYSPTFGVAGCYGVTPTAANGIQTNLCSNDNSGKYLTSAQQYSTWQLGLDIRLTLP